MTPKVAGRPHEVVGNSGACEVEHGKEGGCLQTTATSNEASRGAAKQTQRCVGVVDLTSCVTIAASVRGYCSEIARQASRLFLHRRFAPAVQSRRVMVER
jgi:hypothetical protein